MARTKTKNKKKLPSLPEDIINVILLKLPVKSISCFKCVCKCWYELFKSTKFVKNHLQHSIDNNKFSVLLETHIASESGEYYYTIDFDVTSSSYLKPIQTDLPPNASVPGSLPTFSCDGLIGLSDYYSYGNTILWNPSTRKDKNISTVSYRNECYIRNAFTRYGVCYDRKTDGHMLIKIVPNSGCSCSEVWVRSLCSSSWKWNSIGNIPCDMRYTNISKKPLNGIIHWIGETKVIGCFDIVEKRFKTMEIPSCYLEDEDYSFYDMEVGVLGQNLYLSVNARYKKNIDLWVMKDYGVKDSWTKIFSLLKDKTCFESLRPLHYLNKNWEILLHGVRLERYDNRQNTLVSYNQKSRRLKTSVIPGIPKDFSATTFVGSLLW